jgi:hypothetical protein
MAKALGLAVPASLIARADEVIELSENVPYCIAHAALGKTLKSSGLQRFLQVTEALTRPRDPVSMLTRDPKLEVVRAATLPP